MRAILKVVRCHLNQFRIGIHLTEQELDYENVTSVAIIINEQRQISLRNVAWFRQHHTIEDAEIGMWIVENGWVHDPHQPMKLLKFTATKNNGALVLCFAGASNYRKKSSNRKYILNGESVETARFLDDEFDTLWGR